MKKDWILIVIVLISFITTIFVYNDLPQEIPRQWGIDGEVNSYWGKEAVFFTALLPLILYLLMKFLPKIDPKKESYEKHKKAYNITIFTVIIFLIVIHWISIYVSLGHDINIQLLVNLGVGILFIIIGNYMGQIRHNYFFGIRNPWTLASEEVWKKTHRASRYVFVVLGILFIVSGFITGEIAIWLTIGGALVLVFFTTVYSYLVFKNINNK
ncbi:SdpI family protein [Senegalia massiliensis]|uniref:SdpI family protein n=1 Tax=Senegalia massiliensis TaxID=1720316 RepID=A0A845R3Y2_9CLOT|nr:SdpI family protein [Senegalia massiliensis]NBI08318.1 SdpI family protein [Senegalia massiliensis]